MPTNPEPFPGSWARQAGMTEWDLRSCHQRLLPDVYVSKFATIDLRTRVLATGHWMKGDGVLCGYSASFLHGARWVDDDVSTEIVTMSRWKRPEGVIIRRIELRPHEIAEVDGFQVTTPARTAYDLARWLDFNSAVVAVDSLGRATGLTPEDLLTVASDHPGERGVRKLRKVAEAMDTGAESPPETLTRLLICESGLPRPETQIPVRSEHGTLVARSDLGYREWRVLIEYDGDDHRTDKKQYYRDVDRNYVLEQLGWHVIHVVGNMLYTRPWIIIDRVEAALRRQGWTP